MSLFKRFILDLRDFSYYSIYKSKGSAIADKFYRSQFKYLVAPYFVTLLMGQAAVFFKLNILIPDLADGNIVIMIIIGLVVVFMYNILMLPVERIYDRYPLNLESIKSRYSSIRVRMIAFFIVGLILIPILPYLITELF